MTIDTSAILAILRDEPERAKFVALIEEAPQRLWSGEPLLFKGTDFAATDVLRIVA